jgi:hypothetical protein
MDQAAVARAQENQNALAQYTLGKAKREDAQQNELYAAVRQPGFKLDIGTAMRFGAPGLAAYKAQEEAATRGVDLQIKQKTLAGLPNKQLLDESNLLNQALDRYKSEVPKIQTPDAVASYVQQTYADSIIGPYAAKLKPLDQAIEENVAQFTANPDKWRAMHTNISGLQILQATMPKPQIAGGSIVNMNPAAGQVGAQIPGAPPVANVATNLLIPGPNGTMVPNQQLIDVQTGLRRAGAPNVSVKLPPVENAYSTTFAKNTAEDDIKMLGAARNAPKVAATANRITELLNKPDIFVGPAATVKLNVARALNVLGADETEEMRNTEKLIAAAGQGTLDAIKDAGLGTGQGFTAKDLEFLTNVAGGKIDFTIENLRTMSRLQYRAAELSVKKFTTRRSNMPESATKGTGIDKETYDLPPRIGGPTPEAITYLKANPSTKAAFDKRYGDGEAEHTLRMGK